MTFTHSVVGSFASFTTTNTTTTTTLQQLLCQRLALWDQIDLAFDEGNVVRALQLTNRISDELTPQIREAYGL